MSAAVASAERSASAASRTNTAWTTLSNRGARSDTPVSLAADLRGYRHRNPSLALGMGGASPWTGLPRRIPGLTPWRDPAMAGGETRNTSSDYGIVPRSTVRLKPTLTSAN